MTLLPKPFKEFWNEDLGGMTVLGLFLFLAMMMLGGLAIDTHNAVRARTDLQNATNVAGHAALYWRNNGKTDIEAKALALEAVERNMPASRYGNVITASDIEFGTWSYTTKSFTLDSTATDAVRVSAARDSARNNTVGTYLLKLVGVTEFELSAESIWDYGTEGCTGQGFFANERVDFTSGNAYENGFCVHSNDRVAFQNGNSFADRAVVSMPIPGDIVVPQGGLGDDKNPGIMKALRPGHHDMSDLFNNLSSTMNSFKDPNYSEQPDYITYKDPYTNLPTAVSVSIGNGATLSMADLTPNAVNIVGCHGKTLTIDNNVAIREVVLITDCEIKFNSGASAEDAIVITTDTGKKSVSAPSGFRLGADDSCAGGGGATLMTMGDFTVASGMEVFGSELIAYGDVDFTANADGIEGLNFLVNGKITATANGTMDFCADDGIDNVFEPEIYRMVG